MVSVPQSYSQFTKRYRIDEHEGEEMYVRDDGTVDYGSLYFGYDRSDDPVVVRYFNRDNFTELKLRVRCKIPMEVCLLERCRGVPGVVELLEWFEQDHCYVIVTRRPSPSVDLFDFISKQGALKEKLARRFFREIIDIVFSCCELGVLYGDITYAKFAVEQKEGRKHVILVEFGSDAHLNEEAFIDFEGTRVCCPADWIDIGWNNKYYGDPATSKSLGRLLFALVQGPCNQNADILHNKLKWPIPVSTECADLISGCFCSNPADRLSFEQIRSHGWFQVLEANLLPWVEPIPLLPRILSAGEDSSSPCRCHAYEMLPYEMLEMSTDKYMAHMDLRHDCWVCKGNPCEIDALQVKVVQENYVIIDCKQVKDDDVRKIIRKYRLPNDANEKQVEWHIIAGDRLIIEAPKVIEAEGNGNERLIQQTAKK